MKTILPLFLFPLLLLPCLCQSNYSACNDPEGVMGILQNIYMQSGITFAFSQAVLNKFIPVMQNMSEYIAGYDLDLYYPDVVVVEALDQDTMETVVLSTITIENLDIPNFTFDQNQSSFVMQEPTQQLKMYISNLIVNFTFDLRMDFNQKYFSNAESLVTPIQVAFSNITFTILSSYYVNENEALGISIDMVNVIISPESVSYDCNRSQILGLLNCMMLEFMIPFYTTHMNEFLADANNYINLVANTILLQFQDQLKQIQLADKDQIYGYYGLLSPQLGMCNPFIMSNYMSFMDQGKYYPNQFFDHYVPNDPHNSHNFIPMFYESLEDKFELQLFISEFTLQEVYYAYLSRQNFTVYINTTSTVTTDSISKGVPNYNESFGSDIPVEMYITSLTPNSFKISSGNFFFEPNTYNLTIFPSDGGPEDAFTVFQFTLIDYVFTIYISNTLYYYTFIDYELENITLVYTSNSSFTFNGDVYTNLFNSEVFKTILLSTVNEIGSQGTQINLSEYFGSAYALFFAEAFVDFQVQVKDQYMQATCGFSNKNTSLFENMAVEFLSTFTNGSNLVNMIKSVFQEQAQQNAFNIFTVSLGDELDLNQVNGNQEGLLEQILAKFIGGRGAEKKKKMNKIPKVKIQEVVGDWISGKMGAFSETVREAYEDFVESMFGYAEKRVPVNEVIPNLC